MTAAALKKTKPRGAITLREISEQHSIPMRKLRYVIDNALSPVKTRTKFGPGQARLFSADDERLIVLATRLSAIGMTRHVIRSALRRLSVLEVGRDGEEIPFREALGSRSGSIQISGGYVRVALYATDFPVPDWYSHWVDVQTGKYHRDYKPYAEASISFAAARRPTDDRT